MMKFIKSKKFLLIFSVATILVGGLFGIAHVKSQREDKFVILKTGGGLIDQINTYLVGQRLKELGCQVKYDVSWFKEVGCGFTTNEKHSKRKSNLRTLQIDKLVASDSYLKATAEEVKDYKANHCQFADTIEKKWCDPKACYGVFRGYKQATKHWEFGENINDKLYLPFTFGSFTLCKETEKANIFATKKEEAQALINKHLQIKEIDLDSKNRKILREIRRAQCPIGVHVRLGDCADIGVTSPTDYYVKACQKACEMFPQAQFFFVSDEPDLVKKDILPKVTARGFKTYLICNDVNKCQKDLFLMAQCKHQIRSYGSLNAIAYLMNDYQGKKLIAPSVVRCYQNITPDVVINV